LVDAFEEERVVHMILEMCTGGELFEPIEDRRVRFSERQAARIVRDEPLLRIERGIEGDEDEEDGESTFLVGCRCEKSLKWCGTCTSAELCTGT
jgi:hypothetical protein